MGQIFYSPCTCPVLILASKSPKRTVHDLGLVQVGRSWSCTWFFVFSKTILVSSTGKVHLDLVPGFEIVLVLRMLILKQGKVYQSSWAYPGLGFLAI